MKRKIKIIVLTAITSVFLSACNNPLDNKGYELVEKNNETYLLNKESGQVHIVKNNSMYEIKKKNLPTNKINQIITTKGTLKHTKLDIKSKILDEFILYDMRVIYAPEKNSNITFKEWKKEITKKELYNRISILFLDKDGFELKTKTIYLNELTVNEPSAIAYEGKIKIDKYLASKIDSSHFYYVFPKFEKKKTNYKK